MNRWIMKTRDRLLIIGGRAETDFGLDFKHCYIPEAQKSNLSLLKLIVPKWQKI